MAGIARRELLRALILAPAAAGDRFISSTDDSVDVLSFGAIGDGVTDDHAAFQRACDAGAGRVVVPDTPAGYLLKAPVAVPSGTSIIGSGRPRILQGADDIRLLALDNAVDVTVRGIHFCGNGRGRRTSIPGANIAIESTDTVSLEKRCLVEDCTFEGFRSWAIRFAGLPSPRESSLVEVLDNEFVGQLDEGIVFYRVNRVVVRDNRFRDHAREAIKITSAGHATIADNLVEAAATGELDGPLINVGTAVFDVMVTRNRCVRGNIGIGIEKGWREIKVLDNHCSGQGNRGIGVSLAEGDSGRACVVAGNRVEDAGGAGILVSGLRGSVIEDVTVNGNVVRRCGLSVPHHGIAVNHTAQARITDNRISDVTKHGISVANTAMASLRGNHIEQTSLHGVRVEETAGRVVIRENAVHRANRNGGAYDGISVAAIEEAEIVDNVVEDPDRQMRFGIHTDAVASRVRGNLVDHARTANIFIAETAKNPTGRR